MQARLSITAGANIISEGIRSLISLYYVLYTATSHGEPIFFKTVRGDLIYG